MLLPMLLLFALPGCDRDTVVAPQISSGNTSGGANALPGIPAESEIGPIWILRLDAGTGCLSKEFQAGELPRSSRWINAAQGGKISIGDSLTGISSLHFEAGDLPGDETIRFGWLEACENEEMGYIFEFGPHGLEFNHPAELTISLENADPADLSDNLPQLFYYNPSRELWELVGGQVDDQANTLTAELHHFSRYAVAISR